MVKPIQCTLYNICKTSSVLSEIKSCFLINSPFFLPLGDKTEKQFIMLLRKLKSITVSNLPQKKNSPKCLHIENPYQISQCNHFHINRHTFFFQFNNYVERLALKVPVQVGAIETAIYWKMYIHVKLLFGLNAARNESESARETDLISVDNYTDNNVLETRGQNWRCCTRGLTFFVVALSELYLIYCLNLAISDTLTIRGDDFR